MAWSPTLHRSPRLVGLQTAEISCHIARGRRQAPSESSDSYVTYVEDYMAAHLDIGQDLSTPSGRVEHTSDPHTPHEDWGGDPPETQPGSIWPNPLDRDPFDPSNMDNYLYGMPDLPKEEEQDEPFVPSFPLDFRYRRPETHDDSNPMVNPTVLSFGMPSHNTVEPSTMVGTHVGTSQSVSHAIPTRGTTLSTHSHSMGTG